MFWRTVGGNFFKQYERFCSLNRDASAAATSKSRLLHLLSVPASHEFSWLMPRPMLYRLWIDYQILKTALYISLSSVRIIDDPIAATCPLEGMFSLLWRPGHCIGLVERFISPSLSGRLINSDVALQKVLSASTAAALARIYSTCDLITLQTKYGDN